MSQLVRTAGCATSAAGQHEAVPTHQSELEVLQDSRFSVGLTANLVLWPNSTEILSFSVHHLCLHVTVCFLLAVFALFMLALICANYLGQLAKCTGMWGMLLLNLVLLLVRA